MTKFEQFIKQLEKKKEFKVPNIDSDDFKEIKKEYEEYIKQGFLKQPKKRIEKDVEYLVYKATKRAEKYFKQSKKKSALE